nr:hypothetical protein CFP56_16788 [Quercus suber]
MSGPGHFDEDRDEFAAPHSAYNSSGPPPPPKDGAYDSQPAQATYEDYNAYDQGREQHGGPHSSRSQSYSPYTNSATQAHEGFAPRQAPPRSDRRDYGEREYGYGREPPPTSDVGSSRPGSRPYAPSEPRPHEFNQMAPYDEEKAYAEYHSAYGSDGYSRAPPVTSEYNTVYDNDSYIGRPRYTEAERARGHGNRPPYDHRDYERDGNGYPRREGHESRPRDRRSMPNPPRPKKDIFGQGNGQRGLGAALLGGAAGALISHESGRGALGTLGGIAVGAIGANALEKHYEQRKQGRDIEARRQYQGSYEAGGSDPYYTSRGPSRRDHVKERAESIREMREHHQRRRASSSEDSWTTPKSDRLSRLIPLGEPGIFRNVNSARNAEDCRGFCERDDEQWMLYHSGCAPWTPFLTASQSIAASPRTQSSGRTSAQALLQSAVFASQSVMHTLAQLSLSQGALLLRGG